MPLFSFLLATRYILLCARRADSTAYIHGSAGGYWVCEGHYFTVGMVGLRYPVLTGAAPFGAVDGIKRMAGMLTAIHGERVRQCFRASRF